MKQKDVVVTWRLNCLSRNIVQEAELEMRPIANVNVQPITLSHRAENSIGRRSQCTGLEFKSFN